MGSPVECWERDEAKSSWLREKCTLVAMKLAWLTLSAMWVMSARPELTSRRMACGAGKWKSEHGRLDTHTRPRLAGLDLLALGMVQGSWDGRVDLLHVEGRRGGANEQGVVGNGVLTSGGE